MAGAQHPAEHPMLSGVLGAMKFLYAEWGKKDEAAALSGAAERPRSAGLPLRGRDQEKGLSSRSRGSEEGWMGRELRS